MLLVPLSLVPPSSVVLAPGVVLALWDPSLVLALWVPCLVLALLVTCLVLAGHWATVGATLRGPAVGWRCSLL